MVAIEVDRRLVIKVHENLFYFFSPFFESALPSKQKESLEQSIQLPDDKLDIFKLYAHWLYFKKLPMLYDEPDSMENDEYLALVKAYKLGDKFLDSKF